MQAKTLRDLLRAAGVSAAWSFGVLGAMMAVRYVGLQGIGVDAHAYWLAWRGPMYTTGPMTPDAFLYSPAFAQVIWPLTLLPWPAFCAIFTLIPALGLAWMLAPMGWQWALPLWMLGLPEIVSGNVFVPLGLVAVLGFRHQPVWAVAALTKVTPCIGVLWFLVRKEWPSLARTVAATLGLTALSFVLAPHLWEAWVRFLLTHSSSSTAALGAPALPPLAVRLPLAVALITWGATRGSRWTVPVAMVLATPVLWLGSFTMLAAIPRLQRDEAGKHDDGPRGPFPTVSVRQRARSGR